MRQRSREFGGDLRVVDANPGTLVEAVIPYKTPGKTNAPLKSTTVPERSISQRVSAGSHSALRPVAET
jgi:hypothetical protein